MDDGEVHFNPLKYGGLGGASNRSARPKVSGLI
jgi:hypothetical protein